MVAFLENMMTHASILIIMAISFGRFYAVCYPFKAYSGSNSRNKMILIAIMWICAAAFAVPFFLMAETQRQYHFSYKEDVDICTTPIDSGVKRAFVVVIFCVFFVVPFAMLIVVYVVIILRVVKDSMSKDMKDSKKTQSSDSHKQLVCMLVGIIILFFVCLLPFRILVLLTIYSPHALNDLDLEHYLNVMNAIRLLVYMNSAGNPLIYNIVSVKFRTAFRKALGCQTNQYKEGVRLYTMTHYSYMHKSESNGDAI
ncbi:hypothetical protein SNE40_008527 [Patella caerulea]|uniref:G-protein coupled receptors family 1 profile domain-containing protein n=1 Tax=Patella caerulea TaxID=87958 RepID=A0AAN8K628_PATCE